MGDARGGNVCPDGEIAPISVRPGTSLRVRWGWGVGGMGSPRFLIDRERGLGHETKGVGREEIELIAVATWGSGWMIEHLELDVRSGSRWSLEPPKSHSFGATMYYCPQQSYVADQ